MRKLFLFIVHALVLDLSACEEKSPERPPGLGQPAKCEAISNGKKAIYVAELVQLPRTGQFAWIKEKLPSPRMIHQFRTTRQREGEQVTQIGPTFWSENALRPENGPRELKDIPWTPSILVQNGVVWVLFTRNTFSKYGPRFRFYSFSSEDEGRVPDKESVISANDSIKAPEILVDGSPYINVDLLDSRQDEAFRAYEGLFKLTEARGDEVLMKAPVLGLFNSKIFERQINPILDTMFQEAKEMHEHNPEAYPPAVHYKVQMKDKDLLLRYNVKTKKWSLDLPGGYIETGSM
jgi:hypothetical protein